MPLGVAKICSDFLCSRSLNKTGYALISWLFAIGLQTVLLVIFNNDAKDILTMVPIIYLISTLMIYILAVGAAFNVSRDWVKGSLQIMYMLSPLCIVGLINYSMYHIFLFEPVNHFYGNIAPTLMFFVLFTLLISWLFNVKRAKRILTQGLKTNKVDFTFKI